MKYELKEKDLDIVQLQKEINELQLENRIIKAKMPIHQQPNYAGKNDNNPYVSCGKHQNSSVSRFTQDLFSY